MNSYLPTSRVLRLMNEHGDEVELEILYFPDFYRVTATICQDVPPFEDFFAIGRDRKSEGRALKKALRNLYSQAYN